MSKVIQNNVLFILMIYIQVLSICAQIFFQFLVEEFCEFFCFCRGYLGPGGLSENLTFPNCTGGAAGYIDRLLLGTDHIFQYPSAKWTYNTNMPFDPEGLLGILTSIITVILGLQAGKIFINCPTKWQRLVRFAVWTLLTGLLGGILCNFSQNAGWIPVNKNLWSLSYVLVLASMAFALLALFYLVIDEFDWWSGTPFYQAGM